MICNGRPRADGRQLAGYLQSRGENEVEPYIIEQDAFDGMSLDFALRALEAQAIGTRCKLPLYHAQIAPGPGEHLTREQFIEAANIYADEMGFTGLPRVIVIHQKDGHEHAHVVWGRVDPKTETAIDYKFSHKKQERAARLIETRFNLRQVQGKWCDLDGRYFTPDELRMNRADQMQDRVTINRAEQAQEKRGAKPKQERMAEVKAIWQATKTGRHFRDRLADAGYTLARGDRRTYVVVDRAGEAHSLARQAGVTVKEVKARLVDINPSSIPTVQEVREAMRKTANDLAPQLDRDTVIHELGRAGESVTAAPSPPSQPEQRPPPQEQDQGPLTATRALDELTRQHSTFTHRDLDRFARENTETAAEAARLIAAVEEHCDLVHLGLDRTDCERFTSRDMLATELRMEARAADLAGSHRHRVRAGIQDAVPNLDKLSAEQARAYRHVLSAEGLSIVEGFAGSGKSYMLGAARKAWVAAGYRVHGAALSGIAAEGLQKGAQIESRTLHSLLSRLEKGTLVLGQRDVIVLDEAGMVGSRQMERLVSHVAAAKAKLVIVGDAEQLQAIDAGAAFRALKERHGAEVLTEIRRQMPQWQSTATVELATERTAEALHRYRAHKMVHESGSRDQAKDEMVRDWAKARMAHPEQAQIMLAYLRADVKDLNDRARQFYRDEKRLGEDHSFVVTDRDGEAHRIKLATGDRVYCLKNDTRLEVRNGTLGTVDAIDGKRLTLKLDDGRKVSIDTRDYSQIAHGYAATVHKSQGVTVDRSYMLASRFVDRHAAYVGLSRHRHQADLYWSREEFKTVERLERSLSRDQRKDTTLDYLKRAEAGEQRPRESLRAAAATIWREIKGAFRFQPEIVQPQRVDPAFTRDVMRPREAFKPSPTVQNEPPKVQPAFVKEVFQKRKSAKPETQTDRLRRENTRQPDLEHNRKQER